MPEVGTEKNHMLKMMGLCIESDNTAKLNRKVFDKTWTDRGVRQGCKITTEVFNIPRKIIK